MRTLKRWVYNQLASWKFTCNIADQFSDMITRIPLIVMASWQRCYPSYMPQLDSSNLFTMTLTYIGLLSPIYTQVFLFTKINEPPLPTSDTQAHKCKPQMLHTNEYIAVRENFSKRDGPHYICWDLSCSLAKHFYHLNNAILYLAEPCSESRRYSRSIFSRSKYSSYCYICCRCEESDFSTSWPNN